MNSERDILKSGAWYTVGNILVKAITFLALPVFTNIMTTEEFGVFGTYQAYETIVSVLVGLGISGTIKIAFIDFTKEFDRYVSSVASIIIVVGSGLLFVGLFFLPLLESKYRFFYIALIFNCVGNALREIYASKYVVTNEYKKNLLISFLFSILNISISYVLCITLYCRNKGFGRICGTAGVAFFIGFVIYVVSILKTKKFFYKKAWKYALCLGSPLIFHQLSISILSQCDKIMIQQIVDTSAAGIYTSMVSIILVLQVIMNSIENSWSAWFYSNYKMDYDSYTVNKLHLFNKKLLFLFMFLTIGFQLVSKEIVNLMVGEDFQSGFPVVLILSISVFVNYIYIYSVNIEYFYHKMREIALYTIFAGGINIILNYAMVNWLGIIGAAIATLFSRLMLFLLHERQARKLAKTYAVDYKSLLISLVSVVLFALVSYLFSNVLVVRWILAILIAIVGILYIYINFLKVK